MLTSARNVLYAINMSSEHKCGENAANPTAPETVLGGMRKGLPAGRVLSLLTAWLGMLGPVPVLAGVALAASHYGANGHPPYYFHRQTISDLGDPSGSAWASAFNAGMISSGILMTMFIIGVCILVKRPFLRAVGAVGVTATIAMVFAGIFTQHPPTLDQHNISAGIAFASILIFSLALSLYLISARQDILPRWIVAPSILTSLCAMSFFTLLLGTRTGRLLIKPSPGPPANPLLQNIITSFEWATLLSVLLLCVCISVTLLSKKEDEMS